jgi:hypothetical protein
MVSLKITFCKFTGDTSADGPEFAAIENLTGQTQSDIGTDGLVAFIFSWYT